MWPTLTGAELIHDLFRFKLFVDEAGRGLLTAEECAAVLVAPDSVPIEAATWSLAIILLIDAGCAPWSSAPEEGSCRSGR